MARYLIAAALLLMGCVDITVQVPCSAVLLRPDSLKADGMRQDTVVVFRADSLACPYKWSNE